MKKILFSFYLLTVIRCLPAFSGPGSGNEWDCFTILAGKDATADGSVMMAHNEDGPGYTIINWYKVDAVHTDSNFYVTTDTEAKIPQVENVAGYCWLEMPGRSFSDSYMNEYGVIIASNQCKSREDEPVLTDGGIGFWLRRLMAERAHSAREAVVIGGKLIERFGYHSSGRTYCIADAREAWMMSVVNGKHWIACRIPDDRVAVIPNYYTIEEINLTDTVNYLGSSDIIDYAVKRGWFDPSEDKPFNFRLAYGDFASLESISNIARHWQGINALSEVSYRIKDRMPFTFEPKEKVSLDKLFMILQDHYEKTALQTSWTHHTNPHKNDTMRICSDRNQYGFVAHLRNDLPVAVGAVLWLAPPHPCMQPFIPWYCGIQSVPPVYSSNDAGYAIAHHFESGREMQTPCNHAYCVFLDYALQVNASYPEMVGSVKQYKDRRQAEIIFLQEKIEKEVLDEYAKNQPEALKKLTSFTSDLAMEEYERIKKLVN